MAPVFFQREHLPGDVMEGDFTEVGELSIGGEQVKVHLWIVRLLCSGRISAVAFYQTTWECFLEGTLEALESFGGIPQRYRLDNLSPVVKLLGKNQRRITARFRQLQEHYGFKADFCNPASGWEKGSIESTMGHFKTKLRELIAFNHLHFKDLITFQEAVLRVVHEVNAGPKVQEKYLEENLRPLPPKPFAAYESVWVTIDKYSTFSPLRNGHRYSAPNFLVGLSLEARIYSSRIELIHDSQVVANHLRLWGKKAEVKIDLTYIIAELCKKPGVSPEWKHKQILFSHPIWNRFYEKLKMQQDSDPVALREYLKCLKEMTDHGKDNVTPAMELC